VRLHRSRLDRAGGLDELLDRLREAGRVAVADLLPQRVHEHALERGEVAGHVGGLHVAAAAAQRRERRSPLGLVLGQVVGVAIGLRDRADDAADQLGQLARDPLCGELTDLVERGALDQTDEPGLGQLVAQAVEAG
jgi:hypothetical protein